VFSRYFIYRSVGVLVDYMKKKIIIKKVICPFCKKLKIAGSICHCEVKDTMGLQEY
jgi:hypothetical protein